MEQGWFYSFRSVFSTASLRLLLLVLRAISLKHLPRCWSTGMVLPSCLLIKIIFSYSIPLLGVGSLRFFRKCRVITRQRSHCLKSSFRKLFGGDYCQKFRLYLFLILFIQSRYVNIGLFYLRQLFYAKFDLKVHTDQGKSIKKDRKCWIRMT